MDRKGLLKQAIGEGLSYAVTTIKPINYDWSSGWCEDWDFYSATTCDECGEVIVGAFTDEKHCDINDEVVCDGNVSTYRPMMNYYYPLPDDDNLKEKVKNLVHSPLCLVEFINDDAPYQYALALTGGGMDMSWAICEAFILMGFYPPIHFVCLPVMTDRGKSEEDRMIIEACKGSLQAEKQSIESDLKYLEERF